ncbi:MAG TPA: hypothetical protein VE575_12490 [Acidimicrobiales bacterium]|nr:hypothetical protein [Acidimicrobiales bacterium]
MPSGLDGNPNPLTSPARRSVLEQLAAEVAARRHEHVLRVGVDGIDGAGKSTFADELAAILRDRDVPVIRASTDSFHNRRAVRWSKGKLSPEGFYRDSHNLELLTALLLDPLSAQPPAPYRRAAFDEPSDSPVDAPVETALPGTVLVFDGLFLHRPELRDYWDFSIWIDGERRVTEQRIDRASAAIAPGPPGLLDLLRSCARLGRYVGGMRLYLDECDPRHRASAVVDNNDFLEPGLELRAMAA